MPFPPQILDELASAGANITIDALVASPAEVQAVVQQWDRGNGNVTIRNASRIPPANLVAIARALGSRVTLEE